MKTQFSIGIKLTLLCIFFFVIVYGMLIWGIAFFAAPNHGQGELAFKNEKAVGFANVGQAFTQDKYFWSRPSAVNYNAAGSGGSNKGPSNEEYLQLVQARIDTFLVHNPSVKKSQIPVELVTASGSGLDPHISIQATRIQIERIAKARNINREKIAELIDSNIERPLFGLFGPSVVNVLKLNIALDELSK
ncbi:MAG TPA: potassium-transporting ATPase subunit C [Cytophagales bacterium]|jgi:potassium-transporting ATPase KdpC subunit|nr:potassium-transporting ATPase subunit C [Cytophagales bacterium]